ncbi:MAG: extracellular solute-binding protein [Candidatus Rokubacteria bacterium]|nr:extracellular solute-binding protein [Candidatus Rokubacteria bacterium]
MGRRMDRRSFIKVTGAGAAAASTGLVGILESGRAPAYAQGTKLHIVRWVDFVPASDEVLKTKLIPEAQKALGAEITLETINANDIQPRATAAISSRSGPDIFNMLHNWVQLYAESVADVSDLFESIGKAQGGFYDAVNRQTAGPGGKRLAIPHAIVGAMIAYRKSLFDEVGAKEFPKTWQQYREVGKKLKAKGYPIGQTLGHTFGDAPTFSYTYLWSWGGKEVQKDGKTVAINSKETIESVKFMVGFWKDAFDEGGLAWDDSNNNRAFLSGTICATLNGASIYIESLRNREKYKTETGALMHTDIRHAPNPAGPAGAYLNHTTFHHAIMNYSKNQKLAKDFLRWLHAKENYEHWFLSQKGFSVGPTTDWEKHKMWEQDPVMLPYRTGARVFRLFGWEGPPSRSATEAQTKYIITDMYAKAVQGMAPEDAVKWAEGQLREIYGKA